MGFLHLAGGGLAAVGVILWLVSFRHELMRHRIAREMPQAAPSRVAPELHALVALVTAGGLAMLAGWRAGLLALPVQAVLAFVVFGYLLGRR